MQQQAKQFIDLMERQQLLSPDVLDELRRQVAESKTRLTPELLAKLLVDNGHLTKFQATKLIAEVKLPAHDEDPARPAQTTAAEDELGFADETRPHSQTATPPISRPATPSAPAPSQRGKVAQSPPVTQSPPVAQVIVDDDELDSLPPEEAEDVMEVTDADVVETDEVIQVTDTDVIEDEPVSEVPVEVAETRSRPSSPAVAVPTAAPVKRVLTSKPKSSANPYDSFRILGVAILLALVSIAGFFLVNYFWRGSAEDRLKRADEAYEQRSYETAAAMYEDFAYDFPGNEKTSYAKIRAGLAALRKDVEGAPDPMLGLNTALTVLPGLAGEAGLPEQQSDLAGVLISLAGKFNERADRTSATADRKQLMQDMDKLLGLINDPRYVGTNQRNQQAPTLNRIKEDRERILREISRDEELASALQVIDQKLAARETLAAYDVRKALINKYPLLEADAGLNERVVQASQIERTLVTPAQLDLKITQQAPEQVVGRSFVLSHRSGQTATPLKGQTLCLKVKGSVYGLDGASGDVLWRQYVGRDFNSEPLRLPDSLGHDIVLCQPTQGRVARLAIQSGQSRWWTSLNKPLHNPVVESEDLYVASFDGCVASLDLEGGQLKWAAQLPQPASAAPGVAFGKSALYIPAEHSNLFVLSRSDGSCLEAFYLGHRPGSIAVPPMLLLGQLFVFENINRDTAKVRILGTSEQGLELREAQPAITMEGNIVVPPQIDGRHLIVQTDLGHIKVLDVEPTADSNKVSELVSVPKNVFSPKQSWLIADNNRVWVVDQQMTRFDVQPTTLSMQRAWVKNDGDRFVAPPQRFGNVLVHARVPAGNQGARISAVDADSGTPLWETDVGQPISVLSALGGGYLAVNSSGLLYSLANQPIRTQADAEHAQGMNTLFDRPATLSDGRVVMLNRSRNNQLAVVQPADKQMSLLAASFGAAKPTCELVPVEDRVAVGLDNGQLALVNVSNGSLVGTPYQPAMQAGQKIKWNTPAYLADSKTLIAASDQQKLLRLSVGDGLRLLSEVTLESPIVGPLVALRDQVCAIVSTPGGDHLQFIDAATLKQRNQILLPARYVAGPFPLVGANPTGCVVQVDGQLLLISDAGQIQWSLKFPEAELVGPPLNSGDNLIVASRSGAVWSIAANDGRVMGQTDAGQTLSSQPLIAGNNLLVGSDEGAVLALPLPAAIAEIAP